MKNFAAAARLGVLVLFTTGLLTGCKKADAPQFSPAPGTYTGTAIRRDEHADDRRHHRLHHRRQRAVLRERARRLSTPRRSPFGQTPRSRPWPARCCAPKASSPRASTPSGRRRRWPRPHSAPAAGHVHQHSVGQHHDALPPMPRSATPATATAELRQRHGVHGPHRSRPIHNPERDRLRGGKDRQRRGRGRVRHHAARGRAGVRPRSWRVHQRTTRHTDFRDPWRNVPLHHRRLGAELHHRARATAAPIAIANSLTLKAVACAAGYSDSLGHQRRLRHHAAAAADRVAQRRHRQSRGDIRRSSPAARPPRTRTATRSTSRVAASSKAARRCSASSTRASPVIS